jgi:microsomal epoxide hydrolase
MALQPFRIKYTKHEIDDLYRRLDATRWPNMPFDTGWSSGTNDRVLRDLVQYWRNGYDWFEIQEQLNGLKHVRGQIGEEELHCVLYKGSGGEGRPALAFARVGRLICGISRCCGASRHRDRRKAGF